MELPAHHSRLPPADGRNPARAVPGRALAPESERYRLRASGRVADLEADDVDRVVASAMHLWPLAIAPLLPFALLVPFGLWLAFRGRSAFIDDHGREAMNAQLTLLLLVLVPCLGWLLLVPWILVWFVSLVRGAVAGAAGEFFRYPAVLRPIR